MPQFNAIPLSKAPPPISNARRGQQQEYEGYITSLNADQAGELVPDANESVRAIKLRLNRAAKALDRPIVVWDFDKTVYFKLSSSAKTGKRGRPTKQA